ncbi:glycosyltransferase [Geomonas sp. Red32]|uniref:glycosyltransferase n=1 Tax=Geomonas sp. Red32 TaxID=2912856 RepID=UPI00202CB896|nr:glycosyltransferase [Geomonas sp. Red32]MCM0083599.1 glycosyltransferase [Geomonas sp. Red32]
MRTVKLVKYLPSFGWEPVVLTVSRKDSWMPDEGMANEVSGSSIYRCGDWISRFKSSSPGDAQPGPATRQSVASRLKWWLKETVKTLLVPDKRAGWLVPAVLLGLKLIKDEDISLIYATAPPQTPLLVGYMLSILSGKKLIVDYRDMWTGNRIFAPAFRFQKAINRLLEARVLSKADLLVATTEPMAAKLSEMSGKEVVTILNGFDPADFLELKPMDFHSSKVNVVYLGGFGGFRTSRYLIDALMSLDPALKDRIAFHMVGKNEREETVLLEAAVHGGWEINVRGPVAHKEALRYLCSADVLVVFIFDEEDSSTAIPGKVYEYLAAKKPILAFCGENSALACLLHGLGFGRIVNPCDVEGIKESLKALLEEGQHLPAFSDAPFNRRENANRLAAHFDRLMS